MVRFFTAGESHGRALVVILEGIPAGLPIDIDSITRDLEHRFEVGDRPKGPQAEKVRRTST